MAQHSDRGALSVELRTARGLAASATLVATLAMAWPVLGAPHRRALGVPGGEAIAHLWGLVTTAVGLPRHGPFVRDSVLVAWPGGVHLDLVDPLHLLLIAPGLWLGGLGGAAVAWNLLHTLHVVLVAAGAWLLARLVAPDRPLVAAVATAGAVATPYLWSGLLLGRSELLGLTLVPLLLALIGRALRPGSQLGSLGGATLVLAAVAGCGWQPLMQAVLVLVPATLILARDQGVPLRRLVSRLAVVVLPAVASSLPMLWAHLATEPWWLDRLGGMDALGADAPPVDLLGALRLTGLRPAMSMATPPYPGWITLALLASALVRGRRRWAWLGLGLLVLTLGPRVDVGDPDTLYRMPAWLLAWAVPALGGLNDWGRLALAVGPLVSLAGALGLARLLAGGRSGLVAGALCAVLLLDGLSFRIDAPQTFDLRPPVAVSELYAELPPGPVLELPGISPSDTEVQDDNDASMLWALSHGHPVQAAPSPHGTPMLPRSLLMRAHDPEAFGPGDPCLATEQGRLHALGFRSVVLHHDRLSAVPFEESVGRMEPALGQPAGTRDGLTWWTISPGPTGPERCAPPPLGSEGRRAAGPNRFGAPPLSVDWAD